MSEVFFEDIISHLLEDENPSIYLNNTKDIGLFDKKPYSMIKNLENINQNSKYHPEGNVWNHTMMVVDEGAKYRDKVNDKKAYMTALLLHDLGKATTTRIRKGRITSYDHDKAGEEAAKEFLSYFNLDNVFVYKVIKLIRYHMHLLFVIKNMPYGDEKSMIKEVDLDDLSYVFLADRLGRGNVTIEDKEKLKRDIKQFNNRYCK